MNTEPNSQTAYQDDLLSDTLRVSQTGIHCGDERCFHPEEFLLLNQSSPWRSVDDIQGELDVRSLYRYMYMYISRTLNHPSIVCREKWEFDTLLHVP